MGSAAAVRGEASTGTGIGPAWSGTARPAQVATVLLATVTAVCIVALQPTTGSPAIAGGLIAVLVVTGAAAVVDRYEYRIPNPLVAAAAVTALASAATSPTPVVSIAHLLAGALGAGVPLLVVLVRRGIGMGDVKLGAVLGAAAGLVHPLAAPIALAAGAFVAGLTGLISGRHRLALGPFLWIGWAVTVDVFALASLTGTAAS